MQKKSFLFVTLILIAFAQFPSACKTKKAPVAEIALNAPEAEEAEEADMEWLRKLLAGETEDEQASEKKERPVYNPSATLLTDIIHTELHVSFDIPNAHLFGKATIEAKPFFYASDSLILDAKGFDIHEVAIVGSKNIKSPLKYKYDSKQIRIGLDKQYKRDERFKVYIDYTAKPDELNEKGSAAITAAKGLYFIDPKDEDPEKPTQIWTQGETEANSCWFPTFDKPNEKMHHDLHITVEDKYKTLSNGLLVSSKKNKDGTRTDHWKMDMPNTPYLVMMAIGEFAVVKEKWRNILVDYYVEAEYAPYAKNIFGNTPEMLEFFSKILGVDYPWQKYSQVVVRDYVSGAMENTSSSLFGEFMHQTPKEMLDGDYEDVIAHELFHQWFGDLVTCESWANLPLNESFATYSEYLWKEHKYGRDEADLHSMRAFDAYKAEYAQKKVNLIRYDYGDKEDMFDRHSYQKGGIILHMLRKYLGDEAFFTGLKVYLNDNRFQPVEVHHLRLAYEKVTGEDLNWFFNQWFLDQGHPIIDFEYTYDNGKISLNTKQTQNLNKTPIFRIPVDIAFYLENGKTRIERVVIDKIEQSFEIGNFDSAPQLVLPDPEQAIVADWRQDLTIEQQMIRFNRARNFRDKIDAVRAMESAQDEKQVRDALKKAMNDSFWFIRQEAIRTFNSGNELALAEMQATLINLAKNDAKPAVRASAISKLSDLYNDDASLFALYESALKDSSENVNASALNSLYRSNPEKAVSIIERLESNASNGMLSTIATIYSASSTPGKWKFLKDAYARVKEPNEKYMFIQMLGVYTLTQDEAVRDEALPVFRNIAAKESAWWLRLAGIQVLSEMAGFYEEKAENAQFEAETLRSNGSGEEASRLEKDAADLTAKSRYIIGLIQDIAANEKDPTLLRLLRMGGN
jgi:aminopeptidase N